jgi:hypothetical protein
MLQSFKIKCPECDCILIVDRRSGKILEVRKPLVKKTTGDRFEDAVIKMKDDKAASESEFKKAVKGLDDRTEKLDELFKKSLKDVQESDDDETPPLKPFDLD